MKIQRPAPFFSAGSAAPNRDIKPKKRPFWAARPGAVRIGLWALLTAAALAGLSAESERTPAGVGVDEKLGEYIPLTATFTDENGEPVQLKSFFADDRRPVILAPGYYNCPRLCSLVFNGVRDGVAAVRKENLIPVRDYTVLSVSFNPEETPELARSKANNYRNSIADYELPAEGWVFLTGKQKSITALLNAIGYRYKKDGQDYSHAAAVVVVAPDGKISRYLYGFNHRPHDFRLALVEAARGRIGQTFDKVLLYCFRYDPQTGKYSPYAWAFIRIGGALTFFTLLGLVIFLRFYGKGMNNA